MTIVKALLETVDNSSEKIRSCNVQKLINTLKFRKARGIDIIPDKCLRHFPRRPLVHIAIVLIIAFSCHIFNCLGRKLM
jgi:hypothetical protein